MTRLIKPFAAISGGKPQAMTGGGYISMNALKKGSPQRIKELLRILNYLAAPFGSQEDLLLSYGLKDQDYTLDDKLNPVPSSEGVTRSLYVPWQYIARRPHVDYQADLPGFVEASFEAQKTLLPLAVYDPTLGYYAPSAYTTGVTADNRFSDAVRDIILLRRPLSDLDVAIKEWQTSSGDQVRKEYWDAMAAVRA
jgi:putative aldouronate transport system substrate-binding protein